MSFSEYFESFLKTTPMPGGSVSSRTTSPTPSMTSTSSITTVKRSVTSDPMGRGVAVLMNAPVREMLVTYSWMNWSKESNSLLIVSR
jgi:hypothetical protein